jgi:hypothetical protein
MQKYIEYIQNILPKYKYGIKNLQNCTRQKTNTQKLFDRETKIFHPMIWNKTFLHIHYDGVYL